MADNLGVDIEAAADIDDLLCHLGTDVDFHAVAHVEHLVHLAPVGAAALVDNLEERWYREHVVLDDAAVLAHKVEHLGLCAACAVHHAVYLGAQLVEQPLDDRGVGARGRKDELADGGEF